MELPSGCLHVSLPLRFISVSIRCSRDILVNAVARAKNKRRTRSRHGPTRADTAQHEQTRPNVFWIVSCACTRLNRLCVRNSCLCASRNVTGRACKITSLGITPDASEGGVAVLLAAWVWTAGKFADGAWLRLRCQYHKKPNCCCQRMYRQQPRRRA